MVLECCFNKCLRYYFGIKCFLELVYVPCFVLMRTPCCGGFRPRGGGDTPIQYSDLRGINMTPVIARCFERTVYHHYSKKVFEENLTVKQYA